MTGRPLLPLLLLLVVLATAATVTSASPAAQTSSDAARTATTESTPKKKLTTARGASEKKPTTVTTSRRDSTKMESVAEKSTTAATTKRTTAEPTTSKPRGRPTKRRMPVALRRPRPSLPKVTRATTATTEPTKRTTSKSATKATIETAVKTTPTKAPATTQSPATERTKGGRSTTIAPGFAAEVIPAPVCAAIVNSSLKTRQFRRNYLLGFTTCRCQSSKQAGCAVFTPYPTVRPGSASAAHAQEQSGAVDSPDLLLANIWAMQQGCQSNAKTGAICHFGLFGKQPYCDCSVDE